MAFHRAHPRLEAELQMVHRSKESKATKNASAVRDALIAAVRLWRIAVRGLRCHRNEQRA